MSKRFDTMVSQMLSGGPQKKNGNCVHCLIPLSSSPKNPKVHPNYCPWADKNTKQMYQVALTAVLWKQAQVNLRDVLDETRELNDVEYEVDPSSPAMIKRSDARERARIAHRELMKAIGDVDEEDF